jgi:hypothetical protein
MDGSIALNVRGAPGEVLMDTRVVIVLVVALIAVIGVAAWLYLQKRRSDGLRTSFGSEYDRARQDHPDQRSAERALEERKERVEQLRIRALSPDERDRFAEHWRSAQAQFVDDPAGATRVADALIGEIMQARGYPVGEFEQRAADVSVDHPRVVEHYRAAHAIALRTDRGDAESDATEDLRQAFVHYRALFDDLLEVEAPAPREARR